MVEYLDPRAEAKTEENSEAGPQLLLSGSSWGLPRASHLSGLAALRRLGGLRPELCLRSFRDPVRDLPAELLFLPSYRPGPPQPWQTHRELFFSSWLAGECPSRWVYHRSSLRSDAPVALPRRIER